MTLGLTRVTCFGQWMVADVGNLRFEIVLTQLGLVECVRQLGNRTTALGASAFSSGIVPWDVHPVPTVLERQGE